MTDINRDRTSVSTPTEHGARGRRRWFSPGVKRGLQIVVSGGWLVLAFAVVVFLIVVLLSRRVQIAVAHGGFGGTGHESSSRSWNGDYHLSARVFGFHASDGVC